MKKKLGLVFLTFIIVMLASCVTAHEHTYFNDYKYDEEGHWQEASCNHKDLTTTKEQHELELVKEVVATYEAAGYKLYKCNTCNYSKTEEIDMLIHSYSSALSFDDKTHWYSCTDTGYEDLKKDEEAHDDSNEVIIKESTEIEVGLGEYTCSVCKHTYQKVILIKISVLSLPTAVYDTVYVGQSLSNIELSGGEGSVEGSFNWTNPDEIITGSKEYSVTFYPTESDKYDTVEKTIYIEAAQLSVTTSALENGTINPLGTVNVDYASNLELEFIPNDGYQVKDVLVDGVSVGYQSKYTLENITSNMNVTVSFEEKPALPFDLECVSGDNNCYSYIDNTLYFNNLTQDTVYSISGEINGNIVIEATDYNFELELRGLTLTSNTVCPIVILSGNNIEFSAKKDTQNYIYDNREAVASDSTTDYSASLYSLADLKLKGKGKLSIESLNNNGIHSKDDLEVKNLELYVKCIDNALKGNDSVTIENATTTLIATQGDAIKSTNSDIFDKGNQRGIITITGGVHNLYAACDGIDAAYDAVINDESTVLNIYTDKYSSYSENVEQDSNTDSTDSIYYVRFSSNQYKYSVKYYNSDTDYTWVNAEYSTSVSGGRSTYYYYKFNKLSSYSKLAVYIYSSSQVQGQDTDYLATTGYLSLNDSYDTIAFTNRMGSLTYSWTTYSTQSSGMPGGMQEGNSDKGEYSTKGIKAANQITINNGTINIKAYDDAIHANNDVALENNEVPLGNVTINGGNLTIYSNDDGIHADGALVITNGTVNVTNSYEGLEGYNVEIAGGNVSVISSDDGINSRATSGQGIKITGGNLYIYAKGDGIDSNSTSSYNAILFSGGNTVVICNSNGNSAIDSDGGYKYEGGYVVAIMPNGGMTSESTHCSNLSSIGKTASVSLSQNGYLVVNGIVTIKMPCSMTAYTVLLGSNSASISSSTSSSASFDSNGVSWN